jgi:hypothetical protein
LHQFLAQLAPDDTRRICDLKLKSLLLWQKRVMTAHDREDILYGLII